MHEILYVYGVTGELIFENCSFLNNTLAHLPAAKWDGGTAVHITNHNVPKYLLHGVPQFNISFTACYFLAIPSIPATTALEVAPSLS